MAENRRHAFEAREISRLIWIACLNIIAVGLLVLFLYAIRHVLLLLFIASFLALTFNPVVSWLGKHHVPRLASVLGLSALVVGVFALLGVLLVPLLVEQGNKLVESGPEMFERIKASRPIQWLQQHVNLEQITSTGQESGGRLTSAAGTLVEVVKAVFSKVFSLLTILIMAIFMLIFGKGVMRRFLAFLKPARQERLAHIGGRLQKTVAGYVTGTLIIAAIGAVIITVALLIVGVPYFLPLGVTMLFLGIIPYVGPALAAIIILTVTYAASGGKVALIMGIIFLGYQIFENNVLEPTVQHRTIKMNPLLILVAVTIGADLAGILGAILALPVAGAAQVIFQELGPKENSEESPPTS